MHAIPFIFLLTACTTLQHKQGKPMNELNIIPKPVSVVIEDGNIDLALLKSIALMHNSDDEKMTAVYLQKLLQPINALSITNFKKNKMDQIVLSIEPESPLPAEGYQLIIGKDNENVFSTTWDWDNCADND